MAEPIEGVVLPAGWPLPSRLEPAVPATPPPPPPVWSPPAPYNPPHGPAPRPVPQPPADVRVTVDPIRIEVTYGNPEPDPLTWAERLQLRRNALCCALAITPAGAWGGALHLCWQQANIRAAWVIAGLGIAVAAGLDQRRSRRAPSSPADRGRGNFLTRTALCTALLAPIIGLPTIGTAVYIVTGVAP